eukprot:1176602-Prorocentrum_minimum.AAC.1
MRETAPAIRPSESTREIISGRKRVGGLLGVPGETGAPPARSASDDARACGRCGRQGGCYGDVTGMLRDVTHRVQRPRHGPHVAPALPERRVRSRLIVPARPDHHQPLALHLRRRPEPLVTPITSTVEPITSTVEPLTSTENRAPETRAARYALNKPCYR